MAIEILQLSTGGVKKQNSEESWPSHAKLQGWASGHCLNLSITLGGSGSKTSNTCGKFIDNCNVGAEDWLVHNVEQNKDCVFVNYQTQHRVNLTHQPAKVTNMISMTEHGWISVSSKQVRQSQHSRGLKGQTHLGRIAVGSIHKIRGITQIITLRGGSVPESFYRSHFQPLPPWFRLVGRWRTETVRLLTKPRNTQARRQCQSQ